MEPVIASFQYALPSLAEQLTTDIFVEPVIASFQYALPALAGQLTTDIFVEPVIASFQYALPALTGQLTASDINRIGEILIKGFKRRLTSKLFKHDDIIEYQIISYFVLFLDHCLNELKNYFGRTLMKNDMDWHYR